MEVKFEFRKPFPKVPKFYRNLGLVKEKSPKSVKTIELQNALHPSITHETGLGKSKSKLTEHINVLCTQLDFSMNRKIKASLFLFVHLCF